MEYVKKLASYWNEITLNKDFIPRGCAATAYDGASNCVYIYGGHNFQQQGPYKQLYRLDLESYEISPLTELAIDDRINHKMFLAADDKLVIVGGMAADYSALSDSLQVFVYDLKTGAQDTIDTGIKNRGQFAACFDRAENLLYIFGGFDKKDFYSIHIQTQKVEELPVISETPRAGMVMDMLPDGRLFIFSGFYRKGDRAICLNDIILYDPQTREHTRRELPEPFGRTFAKHAVMVKYNKVLIYSGTVNGMEHSRYLYFYDYKNDYFNVARIQPLPGERIEPSCFYSPVKDTFYILGGFEISETGNYIAQPNLIALDIKQLDEHTWR